MSKWVDVLNAIGQTVCQTEVSEEDYESVSKFKWTLAGNYVRTTMSGKEVYLHRFILGDKVGFVVDHIDMNTLNNTRENLRHLTHSQNLINTRAKGYWKRNDTKKRNLASLYLHWWKKEK